MQHVSRVLFHFTPEHHFITFTCRAGMHAAVVEVTNKFKTQATAVFFPEPSRMDKHMRMYAKPGKCTDRKALAMLISAPLLPLLMA
jgi:hypothetical protein